MQSEIDDASELMASNGERDRIDVGAYTKAMQQLETTLRTAEGSGLSEGSPVALVAKELISDLNVIL